MILSIVSRYLFCLAAIAFSIPSLSQVNFSDKLAAWKTQFPKEEVIAYTHKEVITFSLNADPKPGE